MYKSLNLIYLLAVLIYHTSVFISFSCIKYMQIQIAKKKKKKIFDGISLENTRLRKPGVDEIQMMPWSFLKQQHLKIVIFLLLAIKSKSDLNLFLNLHQRNFLTAPGLQLELKPQSHDTAAPTLMMTSLPTAQ